MKQKQTQTLTSILGLVIAILTGLIVGLLYCGFEFIVNDGTNWLWNDLLRSDTHRWRVVPIAIVTSVIYTFTIRLLKEKRVIPAKFLSINEELNEIPRITIRTLFTILLIGSLSLLAGASLGPEASLVALSIGIAAFVTGLMKNSNSDFTKLLALSAISALLSSFFLSLVPMILPFLILIKQKKLTIYSFLIVALSTLVSWGSVHLLKGDPFISVPTPEVYNYKSLLVAFIFGFTTVFLAKFLKFLILRFSNTAIWVDQKLHWLISSISFGFVLGGLYLVGGQSVQFSGSEGIKILIENRSSFTGFMLMGIVIIKLFATYWSSVTGYRGGQVFPSVFIGTAFGLSCVTALSISPIIETGVTIGSIAGIFIGMLNPLVGSILLISLFPFEVFPVVLASIMGAVVCTKLISLFKSSKMKKLSRNK